MMTTLQICVGDSTESVWCDLRLLSEEQNQLLRARRHDGGLYRLEWSNLIDGQRFSASVLQRSTHLLRASAATTELLVEALESDERRIRSVPVRTYTLTNAL